MHIASTSQTNADEAWTMSIEEFARRAGISQTTARRLIAKGQLESVKILSRRLVLRRSAEALFKIAA